MHLMHLDHNRLGLSLTYPDREKPFAILLAKNDDVGIRSPIQTEPHHFDLEKRHALKIIQGGTAGMPTSDSAFPWVANLTPTEMMPACTVGVPRRPSSEPQLDPFAPT